jgi:hypothetical protein
MEAQMAAANKRSSEATLSTSHQMTDHLTADSINRLVTPPKKGVIGSAGTTFSSVGPGN